MKTEDIEDVIELQAVIADSGGDRNDAGLLAGLIAWADRRNVILPPPPAPIIMTDAPPPKAAPKFKGGKATESPDSVPDPIVPSSDPSEPDF